jgi:hypothetical protein
MVKNAQKQAYFGMNNSHKPHKESTDSYKKYSNLQLKNSEIQGFKISRILEWGGGSTPARRLALEDFIVRSFARRESEDAVNRSDRWRANSGFPFVAHDLW